MPWLRVEEAAPAAPRWERLLQWDCACAVRLNRALSVPHQKLWVVVDHLGDWGSWVLLMIALAIFDGPTGVRCALHMFVAGGCALLVYKTIKAVACRPRPCVKIEGLRRCVEPLDEFSFPSGHTLHAVVFGSIAVAYFPVLSVVLLPFMGLIAVSRVVLGLHYPSDVAAGAALGGAVALGSFLFV